jgi:diguanylate cyclase (GGDEF)-like protein
VFDLPHPQRQVLRWSSRPVHLGDTTGQLVRLEDVTREWELNEEREKQGRTDLLTGLGNRRNAEEAINREVSRARRHGSSLSFIIIDIDRFKRVNDTLGHAAGDAALRALGEVFRGAFRDFDLASRWGGEEFLMMLPGEDLEHAASVADRIRSQVEALLIPEVGRITISAGVSELRPDEAVEAAIARADHWLYVAKRHGRNRVAREAPLH